MDSIWYDGLKLPNFPALAQNQSADVLIIGGGIAGILCAYTLKQAGIDVVLVEAKQICSGITGKTTAKITAQHGLIFDKLLRRFGVEKTRRFLDFNQNAVNAYHTLCREIDCDFTEQDAYLYSLYDESVLQNELSALQSLGAQAEFVGDLPLPFQTVGAIRFQNQAQFHPLKFLSAIAQNLTIYENTKVLELMPGIVRTNRGTIRAKKIVVATHFPFLNKHGSYFLKLYQQRSYVLGLQNATQVNGMYIGAEYPNLSLRNENEFLLFGGCGHRTGKDGGGWNELSKYAKRYYPNAKIAYRWATQDCMTLDGLPYIGQYSKNTPNLYVLTGFQKWGMTTALAGAEVIRDLIMGKESPYTSLFSPSRTILYPQLAINGFETTKNLLTFRTPRCPHLGCALKWNKQEHSWDCSCHGSRFSESGEVLDNPATDDKHFK